MDAEWLKLITDLLADESKHFFLSATAGGLAYCLTSTISYALLSAWERLTHRRAFMGADFFIICLCLLAGLSAALLSHSWLDGFALWYTSPLAPPLPPVNSLHY